MDPLGARFSITSRRAANCFAIIIAGLTLASVVTQTLRYTVANSQVRWWVAVFDLNREQNLPSFYQGIAILCAALLLGVIAVQKRGRGEPFRRQWIVLAGLFLFLSMDELCSLHEQMGTYVERAAGGELAGMWHYAWVGPGIVLALAIGFTFLRFVVNLPAPTRRGVIAAGAIYVSGALGLEMVGAWYDQTYGHNTLPCQLLANLEEFMEMAGIAIFNVTLLRYIESSLAPMTFIIPSAQPAPEIRARATRLPVPAFVPVLHPDPRCTIAAYVHAD